MSAPSSPSQSKKTPPLTQEADGTKEGGEASGLASAMKGVGNSDQALQSLTQSFAEASLKMTDGQLKAKAKELRDAIKKGKEQSVKISQLLEQTSALCNMEVKKPYMKANQKVTIKCDLLGYTLMTAPDIETLLQIFNVVSTTNNWNKENCFTLFDEPLYQGAFHYFLSAYGKNNVSLQIDFLCELTKYIGNDNTLVFFDEFLDARYFEPSENNNLLLFSVAKHHLPAVLSFLVGRLDTLKNELQAHLSASMPPEALDKEALAEKEAHVAIARLSNQKDTLGNTLLHYAYQYSYLPAILSGKEECVKGAFDSLVENNESRTALAELIYQINKNGMTPDAREALTWLIDESYYQSLPHEKEAAQKILEGRS
jgi:hypothetical protein